MTRRKEDSHQRPVANHAPSRRSTGDRLAELGMKIVVSFFCLCVVLGTALVITRHYQISLRGNLIAILDVVFVRPTARSLSLPVDQPFVAHAGGAVRGLTYTNSREALDESYRSGFRVFELDFEWTSDGKLVLVHDWAMTSSQFCVAPHVFSYAEFTGKRRCDGLTQLVFKDLREWLLSHPDSLVVTDTKNSNDRLFAAIRQSGRDILPQLILQVYRLSELDASRQLRPRAVWFTVYKYGYPAWALRRVEHVDAIVIPIAQYQRYQNPEMMKRCRCYVHSLPHAGAEQALRNMPGVYGAYLD